MLQRRRPAEQREIALVREHLVPVRDVRECCEGLTPDLRHLVGCRAEPRVRGDADQHHRERREQATRPSGPERTQADTPVAARLREEQRRDQEPREGEEQVDAEVPAPEVPAVEQQHADDRNATQTVERGDAWHPLVPLPPDPHGDRLPCETATCHTLVPAPPPAGEWATARRRVATVVDASVSHQGEGQPIPLHKGHHETPQIEVRGDGADGRGPRGARERVR